MENVTSEISSLEFFASRNSTNESCAVYEPYPILRFVAIMTGSIIAASGVASNSILTIVLWRKECRNSAALYLAVLALLDWWMCSSYIILFGVDAIAIYCEIHALFDAWFVYIRQLLGICKCCQLLLPYIILAASLEKFLSSVLELTDAESTKGIKLKCFSSLDSNRIRKGVIACLTIAALATRSTAFVEFRIRFREHPNCTDYFGTKEVWGWESLFTPAYKIWTSIVLPIIQYFVTFLLLLLLNVGIIVNMYRWRQKDTREVSRRVQKSLRKQKSSVVSRKNSNEYIELLNNNNFPRVERRKESSTKLALGFGLDMVRLASYEVQRRSQFSQEVREATWTMVALVTSHLICTFVQVFVKILEMKKSPIMLDEDDRATSIYTITTDAISFLVMFFSSVRIFIYLLCNRGIRTQLKNLFSNDEEATVLFV